MNQFPKISLITPSYNQGHFIEETILSVLNQGYPNLEYIVIDGGSTDNSVEVIEKYQNDIHFWVSEPDKGQTHAINKGYQMATGDIIGWLNSDDLLAENGLENVLKGFNQFPEADFIHGQQIKLEIDGKEHLSYPPNFPNLDLEYFGSFPFLQPACFYKRKILEKTGYLDESFDSTMDYDFFIRIALNFSIAYVDLPIAIFRKQVDAKTFQYHDDWERDRNRVISKLFRSVGSQKGIGILKELGIYIPETGIYPCSRQFSDEEVFRIIGIFVRDSVQFNFARKWYKKSYQLSAKMKEFLPEYHTERMAYLQLRSKYYQYKLIGNTVDFLKAKKDALIR